MIVVKNFLKRGVKRNSCTTWQWLYWTKLFSPITVERKMFESLLNIKKAYPNWPVS